VSSGERPGILKQAAAYLPAVLLAAAIFLFHLGSPPLTSPNEGLYAEVAREMNETGEFVIPRANGVVYLEKPPLLYWLTAVSMRLSGENAFAARLPSALAAIVTVVIVVAAGRRLFGSRAGMLSGVVLATSLGFALVARQVLFDSLLTFWTTVALLGFWFGTETADDTRLSPKRWLLAGYVALGLAVLTSVAASHTSDLRAAGDAPLEALVGGYHVAFLIGAVFAFAAAAIGASVLRADVQGQAGHEPVGELATDSE